MNDPAYMKPEPEFGDASDPVPESAVPPVDQAPAPDTGGFADANAAPPLPGGDLPIPVAQGADEPVLTDQNPPPMAPDPAPAPAASHAPPPLENPVAETGPAAASRARPIPRINIQAFCEDQATAQVLQDASADRRLAKAHVTVQMGGIGAASAFYRDASTPNLIIVESMHRRDELLQDLERLAAVCDSGTKVVVIGHVNDVLLYRELLRCGVSEYLVMPLGTGHVMECISSLYSDPNTDPLGQVISFIGAKGGAGSSTVCHNVAWAISEVIQSDVVIADFDLPFGTAGLDFNQDPVQGIADALSSPERVDEVLLDRLLSRCSDHLSLFAAPGTLDQAYDLNTGACSTVVDVLRGNVPYIAVDLPHLWTDWAKQVAISSDQIVIVATPDLASLRNAKNLIEKLVSARPNDSPPHLVLNQVGIAKRPEISAKDFGSAIQTDISYVIEFDAALFGTAANNGQMIGEVSSKAKAAEQFRELAMALTDRSEAKPDSKSLLAPILSRLNWKKAGK